MALRCGFFVYMLGGIKEKSEAAILDPYPKRRASTPCKMNKENGQPHFGCISLRYEYTPRERPSHIIPFLLVSCRSSRLRNKAKMRFLPICLHTIC